MTIDIDEVIQEHLHFADLWQEKFDKKTWDQRHIGGCDKEAEKHRKTAEWLKDYKKKEEINQDLLYENERLLKSVQEIKTEIREEKEFAYADFERYKVECLGQDWEDVYDSLPQDDFRYGMERCLEIINKHMSWEGEE